MNRQRRLPALLDFESNPVNIYWFGEGAIFRLRSFWRPLRKPNRYRLFTYWWHGDERSVWDDGLTFCALDDAQAVKMAHSLFEEAICIADQSEIVDESGRIVWANEPAL